MGEVPAGLDPRVTRREVAIEAEAVHVEKMLHRVSVGGFTIESDEPAALGGDDDHPHPLDYFAVAAAT